MLLVEQPSSHGLLRLERGGALGDRLVVDSGHLSRVRGMLHGPVGPKYFGPYGVTTGRGTFGITCWLTCG